MKKKILAIILASVGTFGVAHAEAVPGHQLGDGASASVDITMNSPVNISNELVATPSLKAGTFSTNTVLATGTLTDNDGVERVFDIKFGPEAQDIMANDGASGLGETIVGKNDENNKINIVMQSDSAHVDAASQSLILNQDAPATTATYSIKTTGADQNVAADTYTVSTVAYAWVQ